MSDRSDSSSSASGESDIEDALVDDSSSDDDSVRAEPGAPPLAGGAGAGAPAGASGDDDGDGTQPVFNVAAGWSQYFRPRDDTFRFSLRNTQNKFTSGLSPHGLGQDCSTPLATLLQIIDEGLIDLMFRCTAEKLHAKKPTAQLLTIDEMWAYLGLVIYMAIKPLPSIRQYWSTGRKPLTLPVAVLHTLDANGVLLTVVALHVRGVVVLCPILQYWEMHLSRDPG
jgi:Transposase IS4